MLPPGGTETDLGACCCFEPLLNCFDGIIDDGKAHDLDILPPIKEYLFNWRCNYMLHFVRFAFGPNGELSIAWWKNYLDFHVCLSFHPPSVCPPSAVWACVQKITPIPAVGSHNVTNKSCFVCVMSEKYAFWVTLRPPSDRCCRGKAEVRILNFKTTWSEFQKANQTATEQGNAERISNQNVCSPPQSRSQAVVCVSTPRKYPRSGYFLVIPILKVLKHWELFNKKKSAAIDLGT